MEANNWFSEQIDAYKNDVEYQTELLQIEITEQIVKAMKQKGYTRSKLAQKLGCSNAYITKLLNGKENLTLRKLAEIASVLGTSLDVSFVPEEARVIRSFVYPYKQVEKSQFTSPVILPKSYEPLIQCAA